MTIPTSQLPSALINHEKIKKNTNSFYDKYTNQGPWNANSKDGKTFH